MRRYVQLNDEPACRLIPVTKQVSFWKGRAGRFLCGLERHLIERLDPPLLVHGHGLLEHYGEGDETP